MDDARTDADLRLLHGIRAELRERFGGDEPCPAVLVAVEQLIAEREDAPDAGPAAGAQGPPASSPTGR